MYVPMLHDLAYAFAVASLLLAAAAAPSGAQGLDFSLEPVAVSSISRQPDVRTREERVEVLMADLAEAEIDAFLRALTPAGSGNPRQVRDVEVLNVYGAEGDEVVPQRQEIRMRYQDGTREDLLLRRESGVRLLPPPRQVMEKRLSTPPRFAPVRTRSDLEAVEVEVQREASRAYEARGYRSSWFGEG